MYIYIYIQNMYTHIMYVYMCISAFGSFLAIETDAQVNLYMDIYTDTYIYTYTSICISHIQVYTYIYIYVYSICIYIYIDVWVCA